MTTKTKEHKPVSKQVLTALTHPLVWAYYRVRWTFLTRLCASVPADPNMIKKWLESVQPRVKAPGARSIEEINAEVLASLEQGEGEPDQSFSLLVFQRHNGVLVERANTTRSHMKDCARVLSSQYAGKIDGEKSLSSRVINGLYPDTSQYWIPILRPDGTPVTKADGEFDKPVHAQVWSKGRMMQVNALKRFEYVEPPSMMEFTIKVLHAQVRRALTPDNPDEKPKTVTTFRPCIAEDDLRVLFEYGGTHGYAGERGDGEGRYTYELERLDAEGQRAPAADGDGDH